MRAPTALLRSARAVAILLAFFATAAAADDPATRIIVKRAAMLPPERLTREVTQRIGVPLRLRRSDSEYALFETAASTAAELESTLRTLRAQPGVEFAVPDGRKRVHAIPSDTLFGSAQWYLQDVQPAAIRATTAWDITTGDSDIVVAVLDTGVRFDHPDLLRVTQGGKLLAGYDFVSLDSGSRALTANDGDGWDADPSDPGDWVNQGDIARPDRFFATCDLSPTSSWHGTRVSGMIGAMTDNAAGIAGTGWNVRILPVRVLGKCGGYDSDIVAGMRWAAGVSIPGVPDNPNPARVINMSLGGEAPCSSLYQTTIQQLNQMGVVVVISAGNEGGPVAEPANCPGAIAVGGLRHAGTKVGYSSLGPQVAVSAPAGNCVNLVGPCLFELTTTTNAGAEGPQAGGTYTDTSNYNIGTSFSAPLGAGVAALMVAVHEQLTPDRVRARMREAASAFPTGDPGVPTCHVPSGPNDIQGTECVCTTATCGAGMLNAENAVRAAQRPVASVTLPTVVVAGAALTLDGSVSTASLGRNVTGFSWSVSNACVNPAPTLNTSNQSTLIVNAPVAGNFTLQLTVTDDAGATDSTYVTITTAAATMTALNPTCPAIDPPVSSGGGGGGGGGGTTSLATLFALGVLAGWVAALRRVRARAAANTDRT